MEQPHHEQINLYEELALTRTCAAEAVSLAGAALDPQNGAEVSDSTKQLAISLMHDALARVKEFVVAASKIESISTEQVSVGVVDLFVLQVLRAVYRVCGKDNEDIAIRIEEEVARSVKLPFQGTDPNVTLEGTDMTPDKVVRDMDLSVIGDASFEEKEETVESTIEDSLDDEGNGYDGDETE